jgi:hypothetical protein
LLTQNNEEVKVVQELLRHANSRITLDLYAQASMPNKRLAQSKLVRMVLNKGKALSQLDQIGPWLKSPIPCNCLKRMAGTTRLELATSAVTGQRSNQLNYVPTRQINKMRKPRENILTASL